MTKTPESSLRNNIIVAFFLIVVLWGIFTNQFLQNILYSNLNNAGLDDATILKICRNFLLASTGFTIFGIIFVVLIGFLLSNSITNPLKRLYLGTKRISNGDLDHKVKISTNDELEQLADSFNKMADDLKIYIKNLKETTTEKERMESELRIAHDIQMGIIPKKFPPFPDRKEFSIYATLIPAREVGGDFYDFFFIDEQHLCFVIGDISGKGVPAALFMAMTKTLIKTIAMEVSNPEEILDKVNREISLDSSVNMFVTVFCGILNTDTGEVYYVNGGHNPPLVIRRGSSLELLTGSTGTIVGFFEDVHYKTGRMDLNPGDTIYLYTDGVTEAVNKEHELFTEERLTEELYRHKRDSIEEMVSSTIKRIRSFSKGVAQSDDITILALKYLKK